MDSLNFPANACFQPIKSFFLYFCSKQQLLQKKAKKALPTCKIFSKVLNWSSDYYFTSQPSDTRTTYLGQFFLSFYAGLGILHNDKHNYTGEFVNGKFEGLGRLETMKCVYEGEFVKGKFSGYGEYKSKYSTYFGTWLKGFKEGKGEEK